MSKYGKYKKSVLKDYLVYSDEQIREMAINSLNNYAKLEKIEQLVSFILDDYGNYPDVENFMKPETLEEQIKYIVDNGYETIFINEIEP